MDLSPPQPPQPPSPSSLFHLPLHTSSNSFPVIAIALIGILATAFLLIGYYVFVIKCCLNWHSIDVLHRFSPRNRTSNDDVSSLTNGANDNSKGLDDAIIRSIPVIKFRKLEERENGERTRKSKSEANSYECAVCLSEFEDGERLRVIPNCCHAFHIDCIDIWLQSNANCPLCRSGISPSSILYNTDRIFDFPTVTSSSENNDNAIGYDDDDDFVVIEIQGNNLDEPRLVSRDNEERENGVRKLKHVCSMGDEWIDMRKKDEEFKNVQPIRRSISMDLSVDREFCLEIQQCCSGKNNIIKQGSEIISSCSSSIISSEYCNNSNSSKVRKSIFSFGYGRSSRGTGSVQPVHLDP